MEVGFVEADGFAVEEGFDAVAADLEDQLLLLAGVEPIA